MQDNRTFSEFRKVPGEDDDIVDCDGVIKAVCKGAVRKWDHSYCTSYDKECKLITDVKPGDKNTQDRIGWKASADQCATWDDNSKPYNGGCNDPNKPCMPDYTTMKVRCRAIRPWKQNNTSNIFSLSTNY